MSSVWRKCSSCKKDILLNGLYYVCSVSTCQQKKTDYAFCSVECWDQHIPIERHRGDNFSAIEKRAPRNLENPEPAPRRVVATVSSPSSSGGGQSSVEDEILVVVSKVKKYISDKSGFNTSASTMDALSLRIKLICDNAIQRAREDGRKTVMDRDVPGLELRLR